MMLLTLVVSPVTAKPKTMEVSCESITEIPLSECQVLLEIYYDFGLDNWGGPGKWFINNTPSIWGGLEIFNGHVVTLDPTTFGPTYSEGIIPSGIINFSALEILDFRDAQVIEPIPVGLWTMTPLKEILLKNNSLSSSFPTSITDLPNLEILDLSNNLYTGNIPAEIGTLTNIKRLYLNNNQLTGSIPSQLFNLTHLTELDLSDNLLTGSIPVDIGLLTDLTKLRLENNQFSGSIPSQIGNLSNLWELYLYSNLLTGDIPEEICNLSLLESLYLNNNFLIGSIPIGIGSLDYLYYLVLSNNLLSGNIPTEIGDMGYLVYLGLNNNQLSGPIPNEIGNLVSHPAVPLSIDLENNNLSGNIPTTIGNLTQLVSLNLSGNRLSGDIPNAITTLNLYDAGEAWDGSDGLYLDYNQLNVPDPYPSDPPTSLQTFLLQKDPDWQLTQSVSESISSSGGVLNSLDDRTKITIPADSLISTSTFQYIPHRYPQTSTGNLLFAYTSFELNVLDESEDPISEFTFLYPINISLTYTDLDIQGIDENTLKLYYWDTSQQLWLDAATSCNPHSLYQRDVDNNLISVEVCHLTEFALLGEEPQSQSMQTVFLPLLLK
jgi:Leucine-rich repeat (LRR) protein